MSEGEGRHDHHERTQAAERDYQTQQKQQMINPVKDVEESKLYEPRRGLVPTWIEPDYAGIAQNLECPYGVVGKYEANDGKHPQAEPLQSRLYGKLRLVRRNRIFECRIQHPLLPVEIDAFRQLAGRDVLAGLFVGPKRGVRRKRHPRRCNRRNRKAPVVFVYFNIVRDP